MKTKLKKGVNSPFSILNSQLRICMLLLCSLLFSTGMLAITGSGTQSSPFTIVTAADLDQFKTYVHNGNSNFISDTKYWRLDANIN